jgi:hypothetical protein
VPAHHLNEGGLRLAAQTAAMWRNAQIIIPAIHRRRPSPIAADSVPLTIPTAFDRFLGHQTSAPPPKEKNARKEDAANAIDRPMISRI